MYLYLKIKLIHPLTIMHTMVILLIICSSVFIPLDSPEKTASYSLYVVGSNGVLTEHVLQPQKLSSAADGEDAPIELTRFPKTAWRLMGYVSTHTHTHTHCIYTLITSSYGTKFLICGY